MIQIAPSLLSCDFARLADEVKKVEDAGADLLHVDVMDAHFVPNLTIGPAVIARIAKVARVPLDVHVMITDPLKFAGDYLDAGAAKVSCGARPHRPADRAVPRLPHPRAVATAARQADCGHLGDGVVGLELDVEVEHVVVGEARRRGATRRGRA